MVARQREREINILRCPERETQDGEPRRYLTHPQVEIDPAIPVPEWSLSAVGRDRVTALAARDGSPAHRRSSPCAERKAIETAEIPGAALGLSIEVREAMHENDRSATGVLPAAEFDV